MQTFENKAVVGALEVCNLPDLAIEGLHIRVDTGAATSSLHVDNLEEFERDGKLWVSFDIHPDIHNVAEIVRREARVKDIRKVKSSTATRERRYVIDTTIIMAGLKWTIQLTLTDRSEMTYLMLLGRQAMEGRLVVDPGAEYLLGKKAQSPSVSS
ncbi:ATP-dependent zinc protease [Aestuariibacter halophilus]|uniref:ATP-dependent zinc protease n=1 Tax=Fluctibacter halophilus TaxID=226011 RepID=A0ABS8G6H3_9ALTE|nr:ATP-dependent zinc protease [Aestuariibacter halophilus]MCC2615294.1 ATP-dependent zinc protease [Aestuariibacter halophilus]